MTNDLEKVVAQYLACAMEYELEKVMDYVRAEAERTGDPRLVEILQVYYEKEHSAIQRKLQRILEQNEHTQNR